MKLKCNLCEENATKFVKSIEFEHSYLYNKYCIYHFIHLFEDKEVLISADEYKLLHILYS